MNCCKQLLGRSSNSRKSTSAISVLLRSKRQYENATGRLIHSAVNELSNDDVENLAFKLQTDGFVATASPFLGREECTEIKGEFHKLFRGEFETGIYPDEWHYREGISLPNVTREICNSWKSSSLIASVVLNQDLGRFVSELMGWESVRLAQDDVIWKVPCRHTEVMEDGGDNDNDNDGVDSTVGYHQDSAYISTQFEPYDNNSVTVWFALDDVYEHSGCLEYASASHRWPLCHGQQEVNNTIENDNDDNNNDDSSTSHSTSASFHSSDASSYRDLLKDAASNVGIKDNKIKELLQRVPVKMGHAVIHHQDVWHGSGPNKSQHHRRALVAHYLRGDIRFRSDNREKSSGPWGCSSYIYGRYKKHGSNDVDESFFPIVFAQPNSEENRTGWIDVYTERHNGNKGDR
mmetsp:Transcript_5596/g.8349  ORF Transcript_5596/g.8349 Transcript_5596/m.8349 type:complete len:405 (-) Transcript_5596:2100-3314(-)